MRRIAVITDYRIISDPVSVRQPVLRWADAHGTDYMQMNVNTLFESFVNNDNLEVR